MSYVIVVMIYSVLLAAGLWLEDEPAAFSFLLWLYLLGPIVLLVVRSARFAEARLSLPSEYQKDRSYRIGITAVWIANAFILISIPMVAPLIMQGQYNFYVNGVFLGLALLIYPFGLLVIEIGFPLWRRRRTVTRKGSPGL